MAISKKEKMMLMVLGAFIIGAGYYKLAYVKQVERVNELTDTRDSLQADYDQVMETISTIEARQGQVKIYNSNIAEKSKKYYPELTQESIILEVDRLLEESGLKGTFSLTPVTVGAVEVVNVTQSVKPSSSLQEYVDEYRANFKDEFIGGAVENTSDDTADREVLTSSGTTVEQLKISMSFTATYDTLKKFLDIVDSGDKKLTVTNLSLSGGNDSQVSGSFNLEFYGIPKLENLDSEKLIWTLNNTYGKDMPFSSANATGQTIESLVEQRKAYDFIMSVKSNNSNLPTIMLGEANDKDNVSYVYADNKGIEPVEIELLKVEDQYYCKYKTSYSSYPLTYAGKGEVFTPVGDDIVLEVNVQGRVDDSDLSGAEIKIINNTDKTVNVNIAGDDSKNPRVTVHSEGNSVKVTNK